MSEEQAVQLLNEAKLETDGNAKVDKLKGVYELVVNKDQSLIEEFLPEVVELQVDPSPQVRKYLPEFINGAAQARPTAAVLQQCLQCAARLISDNVPAAAKQAVLSSNLLLRIALTLVVAEGADSQQMAELRSLWEVAQGLKANVVSVTALHKNDGVRLNAAKFLEQAVLLLTADSLAPVRGLCTSAVQIQPGNQVVTKSALVKEAEGLLSQLVALLKLRFGEDVSGPVAIVVVKSAGVIAQQRPQFMGRVLPALLALASSGTYKVDAAEGGMQSSVANALKGALAGVLRCTDPKAVTWRKKVVDAMTAMGAGALAESTLKQVNRANNKRGSSEEPDAAKRPRLAGHQVQPPVQQPSTQQPVPQQQPALGQPMPLQQYGQGTPQQLGWPPGAPSGTPPLPGPGGFAGSSAPQQPQQQPLPPPTSEQDLQRVLTVLQALVAKGDAATLAAIVGGLQPSVLADVVLALVHSLPPRHALPPDHAPLDPWVLQLLQLLAPESHPIETLPAPGVLLGFAQQPVVPVALPQPQQYAVPPLQQQQPAPLQPGGFSGLGPPTEPPLHAPQPQLPLGLQPPGMVAGAQMAPPMQGPGPSGAPGIFAPQALPAAAGQPLGLGLDAGQLSAQVQVGREPTPPPLMQPGRGPTPPLQPGARGPTPPIAQQPAAPPAGGAPKPAAPPKAAARPAPPVPAFQLTPLPLTAQQQADLRRAAVLRILASRRVASPRLQRDLVARLAASCGGGGSVGDAVLQFLLEDFAGRGGFDLCMQWLCALFAAECAMLPPAAPGGGGAAAGAAGLGAVSLAEFANSGLDSFGIEGFLGVKAEEPPQSQQQAQQEGDEGTRDAASPSRPPDGASRPGAGGGGGRYEVVLMALLEGLREALPPSDQSIKRVLLEAPSLPQPAVRRYLHDLCAAGPDWATMALLAARDLIDQRPPSRQQVLGFVLEAAGDASPDVRSKAVRLTANRLFPQPAITAAIERHARQQLDSMIVRAPRPASAASAAPGTPHGAGAAGAAQQAGGEAAAAAEAGPAADGAGEGQALQPASPTSGERPAARGGTEAAEADADAGGGPPAAGAAVGPDEATAAQLCALYCALCTKKHSLLRHLFEVYGQTSDGGRAAIHKNAPGLAKTVGASAAALLAVVQDPPEGSLNLVINMLYVLTEACLPPPPLVAAGRQLFALCHDARVLPPLLPGMDKAAALRLLPAVLELAPEAAFKAAVQRLVTPQRAAAPPAPGGLAPGAKARAGESLPPLFQASELLVALHALDHSSDPALLRRMMAGVTACLAMRELFGREALAAAIGQLLTRAPLPQLFMRTVIQSLAAVPPLRPFVCSTLAQLVTRQVWNDGTQWKGWVMCAQQAAPDSFPAWLQLPAAVLARALQGAPEPLKRQLAAYAASPKCTQAVPRATLDLLQPFLPGADGGAGA